MTLVDTLIASFRGCFFNFCPVVAFSLIRTLDWVIICYMKATSTVKHEQLVTLIWGVLRLEILRKQGWWLVLDSL